MNDLALEANHFFTMDTCIFKNKDPEQPHPGVAKLVAKLTENIAHISGIRMVADNTKDVMQKNKYWEMCHTAIGIKNYNHFKFILLSFLIKTKELSRNCYRRPNRASKLSKFMKQAMVFFHLQFQDMKETVGPFDCTSYYRIITDLLALYLDMELCASRRRKEHLERISGRLTSFLIIILDNSQEYILDVLLKSRFSKGYQEICNGILKKFLSSDISSSVNVDMYIRYILAYKLWKKLMKSIEEKRQITKIALGNLILPQNLQHSADVFGNVLPKLPKTKKDPTLFFIQAKFKIKSAYEAFLKSSENYQENENENLNHLQTSRSTLKTKKKICKPLSKQNKASKDSTTQKCNYKKLRKKKCRKVQKRKLTSNTNSLHERTDVEVITIGCPGSDSIEERKLADEFSLKNSINDKEDVSTCSLSVVSNQPNLLEQEKSEDPPIDHVAIDRFNDKMIKIEPFSDIDSPSVGNELFDHKTTNEYSSVDSSDFIPKIEKIDWIEEAKKDKTFITNLVPYLPLTDTKDIKSNCEVKQEVFSPEIVTIKQEPVDDIHMEVDSDNQITFNNGKLMSQPIDSNDNYVSETTNTPSFSEKSPFKLMKNLSDPFIIESQALLEERTNLELPIAPRESLEYDFVPLNNTEKGESIEHPGNSSLNEGSNYIIDDCEELFSSGRKDSFRNETKNNSEPENYEQTQEQCSEPNHQVHVNNEPSGESNAIIIFPGGIYPHINPGSQEISDTHFDTVGECDVIDNQLKGQGDRPIANEGISSEEINVRVNENQYSKGTYNINIIAQQYEDNTHVLGNNESNLEYKFHRSAMKDYPNKLTHLQESTEIEKETCTTLEIHDTIIFQTCGIGEAGATDVSDNSVNTITFIRDPTSIDMSIPGLINTHIINNTCSTESMLETFNDTENESEQSDNGQDREHTSQLTDSQILSLEEFLIIKEKKLGGNSNELSISKKDLTKEPELQENDTVVNSNSFEYTNGNIGENSNFLVDSIQIICQNISNNNESDTHNSGCKTDEPNIRTKELEIDSYNKSVVSKVSVPENSCERQEDTSIQKSNLDMHFNALFSKSSTTGFENINLADQQLLNFNKEAHPMVNIGQIDVSNGLLETSKSSKSNHEFDLGHVVSNRFKGVRLSRNKDSMIATNQNFTIMGSVKSSDIESDRVNINNTIPTSDLPEPDILNCRLENPKTLPEQQDQNFSEKTGMDIPIANRKTTDCKRVECNEQNISEQKLNKPLQKILSKTDEVEIDNPEVSKVSSKKTFPVIHSRAYLTELELSCENERQIEIAKDHSNLQGTILSAMNCSKFPSDSNNDIILSSNEVRLVDKNSSDARNSCCRIGDANPYVKNVLGDMSPDVKGANSNNKNMLISNKMSLSNKVNSETENLTGRAEDSNISNEMKLTDKNGSITPNTWYPAHNSNLSTNFFSEDIISVTSRGVSQNILEHTSAETLCCEEEAKQLPQHLNIPQTEVSKISYCQFDNNNSCINNTQSIGNGSVRKCKKRKDTEELSTLIEPEKVDFYLTPILNGFSHSVGSEITYVPLLQPPQVSEELIANLPLICTCASCYAHFLKQSEKNQAQDSSNHPLISDKNYIYIEGELVENEVITVMKKLEWFLIHVISNRKEPEDLEFKYKQDSESPNLPFKKRVTLGRGNSFRDEECFPSYSKKRMMSIAELEITQNPSYYRPGPFQFYDVHLNPNGPIIDCPVTSNTLYSKSRSSNYNSTMVFHNGPCEYVPLDTLQQYPSYSNQQHSLQSSVASEAAGTKYANSNNADKRYSLDRALDEVNKSIIFSKGTNAKYNNNYYEIRYKYNSYFQES